MKLGEKYQNNWQHTREDGKHVTGHVQFEVTDVTLGIIYITYANGSKCSFTVGSALYNESFPIPGFDE